MRKNLNKDTGGFSRRDFIKASAALAAAGLGTSRLYAAGSDKIRIGLIGCGGRGNGALGNHLSACKHIGRDVELVATADWFKSRAEATGKKHGVPSERCFTGAHAYKKLLATDIDIVLIATSPNFRPVHVEAAVKAGKNVFMEKPVAVDPPGARRIIAAGELAKKKGLGIVAGTQRRHQRGYRQQAFEIENGAKGKVTGGRVSWCGGALWYQRQKDGESDADYMIRNWVSFTEMSGDHIVEQHVHNLDVANWFIGRPPVSALGFGGRARRKTGDQFDFHSIDFDWGQGVNIHSMCRQINGTEGGVWENFVYSGSDKKVNVPDFPEFGGPYVQEHIDLINSIFAGKPLNEAHNVAQSTMTAIMGRIATYTGRRIKWADLTENKNSQWYNFTLKPTAEDFEKGPVTAPEDEIAAIPGKD